MRHRILKGAVIGLGKMGAHHARLISETADVELMAIVEPSYEGPELLPGPFSMARWYRDIDSMLEVEEPDFVVVATPTSTHFEMAEAALQAGCHCLVEKPVTLHPEDGIKLGAMAGDLGLELAVGHVERFNPAVLQISERLKRGEGGKVLQLSARRTGPFPARVSDVGVVRDLAIHDIDVMLQLAASPVRWVRGETARHLHEKFEDLLAATLSFESGAVGLLEVNWLTPFKRRELVVTCSGGTYVVNYLTQELTFYENGGYDPGSSWEVLDTFIGMSEGQVVGFEVHRAEPLRLELESFLLAIRHGSGGCVRAVDSVSAMHISAALLESAASGQTVRPLS